ncbi:MAG: dihydropteroate synthase [Syntrophales bacterium]|nr:dihydropteroate synthase [Syntrophales bacterium]MDD5534111.1 dihydropteroate synthase [Syntrophales bacterium]
MVVNARPLSVASIEEAAEELRRIGVEPYGVAAMAPKMLNFCLLCEKIESRAANIMKQDMLSIGGDVAVSRGTVDCSIAVTDAIVIGTIKQIERFAEKLSLQPFGLRSISEEIRSALTNIRTDSFTIKTPRRDIFLGRRTLVMGILNPTPDSFSDGGDFLNPEKALDAAIRMAGEGADIIDVGGESSRPGAQAVAAEEETRRIIPVIEKLSGRIGIPISVDTTKANVARLAVEAGAEIINDISAASLDPEMAGTAARLGTPIVLMHMRGTPSTMQTGDLSYRSLCGDIIGALAAGISRVAAAGVAPDRVIIDPGIGFGKTAEGNVRIIRRLRDFKVLGRPILIGPSRKRFTGTFTGVETPRERIEGTAAAVTASVMNGAHIVRVHDVEFMRRVCDMADAIKVSSL